MPIKVQENVPLAPLTTFKVGGPARYFVDAASESEVSEALAFAKEHKVPLLVLGGGSNVLISDEGWPGLVLRLDMRGITSKVDGDSVELTIGAGETWDNVPALAAEKGWVGAEALSGIPGSTGGAVVQNAAAYGQALQDLVVKVRAIDTKSGEVAELNVADAGFRYRDSRFKTDEEGRWVLVSIVLKLKTSGPATFGKREPPASLAKWFNQLKGPATPSDVRNAVLDIRESKGMVIMEGRHNFMSAGSFFRNPHVTKEQFARVANVAKKLDAAKAEKLMPWNWPQPDGKVKLSAAFLIEYTKFKKGYVQGHVGISPRQPLAIINLGGANAADIWALSQDVRVAVRETFGVELEPEVKLIGF